MGRILITGGQGMLAKQLAPLLLAEGYEVDLTSKKSVSTPLDITDESAVNDSLNRFEPEFLVNCAAYTAVDKAEAELSSALSVNALGPKNLAIACRARGIKLIQISTDYVYGGERPRRPVREGDLTVPCGAYGYSKFLGDEFVSSLYSEGSMILRTSWLHGSQGPNFVHTMLKLFKERDQVKVVNDQFGTPTWVGFLCQNILGALRTFTPGLYHAANAGECSWFEFATKIRDLSGLSCNVLPQSTSELARPAPRPAYSALNSTKLENLLGVTCQTWEEGLKEHLEILAR